MNMPRKQYDILKDLFIAHQKKDEAAYRERAQEYIRYLRWKKFNHLADEFEAIFSGKGHPVLKKNKTEDTALPLFEQKSKTEKKVREEKPAWQVSYGIDVDLMRGQRLVAEMISLNKKKYPTAEITQMTGYSKNKAQGLTRPLYFMGLIEDQTKKPTELARLIYKRDPYFEDIGTLWFLHYHIASQENYIIWNGIANSLMQKSRFSYRDAEQHFSEYKSQYKDYFFHHHLQKEFRVITNVYTQSEFGKLNILQRDNEDVFIRTRPVAIPDEVLYAVILYFKELYFPGEVTLEIKKLLHHENAPERLLFLNEDALREALERLRMKGLITIESFADLDQIKFNQPQTWLEALEAYYKQKFGLE